METTLDGLLNRRITLEQPAMGYRVAVDTVLLAAAVMGAPGMRILDLGCGAGGVMLCMAARLPDISALGVEIDTELADLCRRNIARNHFSGRLDVRGADATQLPPDLKAQFDHVVINPPYHDETRHDASADAKKRAANTEKDGDLARWLASAAFALKSDGTLTLIHRADREDDILRHLARDFGALEILPVMPKEGAAPKRIIVRARKAAPPGITHKPPFILHEADGRFTGAAESILRHGNAMAI